MSTIPEELPREILQVLGVQPRVALGGRLNKHWQVERGGEVFVLRRWAQAAEDLVYERNLLERLAALGWPVAPVVGEVIPHDGALWSLALFLPGEPPGREPEEQRAQGRLLAELHTDLQTLTDLGQRGEWRRGEATLNDPEVERLLQSNAHKYPRDISALLWHLERAREHLASLSPQSRPDQVIHGDFTPWNLRFQDGKLTGVLDFELAHRDHRIGDFFLAWRGKYDEIVHGYHDVSPLEPEEWALLTPLWWAFLIQQAADLLKNDTWDDGWIISKLRERSPLMGADAVSFPSPNRAIY